MDAGVLMSKRGLRSYLILAIDRHFQKGAVCGRIGYRADPAAPPTGDRRGSGWPGRTPTGIWLTMDETIADPDLSHDQN